MSAATTRSAPACVRGFCDWRVIEDRAVRRGILDERAENRLVEFEGRKISHDDLDPERARPGLHDLDRLRMTIIRDEKYCASASGRGAAERHGLGRGGPFVEQRSIGNIERRQVGDHRLKIQERFEPALCDLRLVRRVGGVPSGILQDVSLNDWRRNRVVIAGADKGAGDPVFLRDQAELSQSFRFGFGLRANLAPVQDGCFAERSRR